MSFREKSAWVSMLSMLAIAGYYYWALAKVDVARPPETGHYVPLLIGTIVILVVVQVLLHIALALHAPKDARAARDEREALIELKATRIAFYGLTSGVALACCFRALTPAIVFDTNSLLFVLVASEVVRAGSQIIYFRVGV